MKTAMIYIYMMSKSIGSRGYITFLWTFITN